MGIREVVTGSGDKKTIILGREIATAKHRGETQEKLCRNRETVLGWLWGRGVGEGIKAACDGAGERGRWWSGQGQPGQRSHFILPTSRSPKGLGPGE